ncbi:twin-arginine translocase TatA/TatE family subunit [Ornithinimicrobium cryptoxanthini]|uniref:Twin-arginine translocase TatA/TatE family subunit n=1 Tax=Ornithinimicrobium cryptoxanthini TaxID=2934161 RepID=A0ABY4YE16_9MICO|nr:twin-arginine translocase TatA/TatE family subunit [Ornithinimicrobium cryptoxanthini]USQ74809.1 twin-arginine translocase TatA/TatE family subunit [Ornithinimicrobium cryptoxanthini]
MKPSAWQIGALIIVLILLFGWKSLPNMARSLGQSMRIFKSEVDQMKEPSAASRDTVPGETADRYRDDYRADRHTDGDVRDRDREDRDRVGLRDRADDLKDRARDTADDVRDRGAHVRDEFRDGLRGDDGRSNNPRA